jgi:hypothetical protein
VEGSSHDLISSTISASASRGSEKAHNGLRQDTSQLSECLVTWLNTKLSYGDCIIQGCAKCSLVEVFNLQRILLMMIFLMVQMIRMLCSFYSNTSACCIVMTTTTYHHSPLVHFLLIWNLYIYGVPIYIKNFAYKLVCVCVCVCVHMLLCNACTNL